MNNDGKIILGIDPGTKIMGYGILEVEKNCKLKCKSLGVVKFSSKKEGDIIDVLLSVYNSIEDLIYKYKPSELAIEAPFFGKNAQSMLKLGRVQGVVIAACLKYGLAITEYMPKKIKQSITGNGNAEKMQVYKMIEKILNVTIQVQYLDATDALGVALCHFFQNKPNSIVSGKKDIVAKDWKDFVRKKGII